MINFDKPKFITFEGGEGSGKSTQSRLLHKYLLSKRIKSIHTREIGGTIEAEKIRHLLVYSDLYPMSELMLVMAARYEHINKVIIPALLDESWVICDRFIDSTACYQLGDSGLTIRDIYDLHTNLMRVSYDNKIKNIAKSKIGTYVFETPGVMPDITFFMDIPPEVGLKRVQGRGHSNKFENKSIDFHYQIYERFKDIIANNKERIISILCQDKSIIEIHQIIIDLICN